MYLRRPTTTSINSSCVASSRMTTSALWMPFFVVVNTGTKKACITVFVEDQNDSVLTKVRQLDRGVERDASSLFDLKVNVWRPCIEADADIVELLCEQLSFFRSGMKNVFFLEWRRTYFWTSLLLASIIIRTMSAVRAVEMTWRPRPLPCEAPSMIPGRSSSWISAPLYWNGPH